MKYNMNEIMTRAWEIKRENTENMFSLCLKMTWAEAKEAGNRNFYSHTPHGVQPQNNVFYCKLHTI